jgi:hypothetical protein
MGEAGKCGRWSIQAIVTCSTRQRIDCGWTKGQPWIGWSGSLCACQRHRDWTVLPRPVLPATKEWVDVSKKQQHTRAQNERYCKAQGCWFGHRRVAYLVGPEETLPCTAPASSCATTPAALLGESAVKACCARCIVRARCMCSDTDMGVGAGCAAATPGGITISNARGLEPLDRGRW